MLPLIRFDAVSLAFGDQVILDAADFAIFEGERVCLIGRNGAGKTSTLRLLNGDIEPDEGRVERSAPTRISVLEQRLAEGSSESVYDFVAAGMAEQLSKIARYEELTAAKDIDKQRLADIEALEREILAGGGWAVDKQVDVAISQLDLPRDKPMHALSGGWRRRVALARALVSRPELLLLDEPTNHLDISTIEWLEHEIRAYSGAVLFVTHDRDFVESIATRIVDIDRGHIRSWPGSYRDYVQRKRKAEADEDAQNKLFDKKLAEEEAWIRQGIKAREHRNEGRVRALEEMRETRAMRVSRARAARIHVNESGELSGRKVIEAKNVTHGYGGRPLIENFSVRIMRGERIGIIGNNGVGKSTLLKLLLGEIAPDSGTIKLGTNLEVAYFDQLRRELDTSKTVAELVGEGRDYLQINGRKKHVIAYLTDFLFSVKRARTRIAALSGGERNRVILAKLFTQSANLLVLDEPTNDLDVETLEALEARLVDYAGTLIAVSHDRHFLDAVVTSTLVFEADGSLTRHAGGYSDWARLHRELAVADESGPQRAHGTPSKQPKPRKTNQKLSYKLQRELDALPDRIERCETELASLQAEVTSADFYQRPHEETRARLAALADCEQRLEQAVERWAELEAAAEAAAQSGG
jgi:ATP-binding cassette subfamily F protein uup